MDNTKARSYSTDLQGGHDDSKVERFAVLDGWRAISILLVLGAHLLPLGPHAWGLNDAAGKAGMALFFTLSGFLITKTLIDHPQVRPFLVRRLFRIVPLAWLALAICMPLWGAAAADYMPNFFFYANLPPQHLLDFNAHFWSLGVEMQFYLGIALVVGAFGRRGLMVIPAVCVAVTAHRLWIDAEADIVTWRRVDEILAGGILALAMAGHLGAALPRMLSRANIYVLMVSLALTCLSVTGELNCLRAYAAAALVGATLYGTPKRVGILLRSKPMAYIATISFALYVIHGILQASWLGRGDTLVKYEKRPLLFALTFGLAHLSTFYFERRFIAMGKRIADRFGRAA